jgi:hypothetical protein
MATTMAKRQAFMAKYEYMRCKHIEEFKQRLQWLSEGMLKNHMTNGGHVIDAYEIELYKEYKDKEDKDNGL